MARPAARYNQKTLPDLAAPAAEAPPPGQLVWVWRNLNAPGVTWSVRAVGATRVGWRAGSVVLDDATLVVQPAGRARARTEEVRNVHAYVRGRVAHAPPAAAGWVQATYDPFGPLGSFFLLDGTVPVGSARHARLDAGGLWLAGPDVPATR